MTQSTASVSAKASLSEGANLSVVMQNYIAQINRITVGVHACRDNIEAVAKYLKDLKDLQFFWIDGIDSYSPEEWHKAAIELPCAFVVLKIHPYSPANEREQAFIDSIAKTYAEGPEQSNFARALCLARIFLCAYHCSHPPLAKVPKPYLQTFMGYLLEKTPPLNTGDGEKYVRFMEAIGKDVLAFLTSPQAPHENRLIVFRSLVEHGSYARHAMITSTNLRRIMELRYKLLQQICAALKMNLAWNQPPRAKGQKIRLGLVAKTMMAGPETWGMLANIAALDKSKYEIILFCTHPKWSGYSNDADFHRRLSAVVDEIVLLTEEIVQVQVEKLRGYNLDILWHQSTIGLDGLGSDGCIFAHKLARVGCTNLGMHAVTAGNPHFQYYIAMEPVFTPCLWHDEFTETELNISAPIIDIPVEKWAKNADGELAETSRIISRQSLGIPVDAVVYFGGAALAKYTAEVAIAWLTILKNVPGSYLVLYPYNPAWYPDISDVLGFFVKLHRALTLTGVDAGRIKIVHSVDSTTIAQMHAWGDIYLSSFPYGGVTSLSEALYNNVCAIGWAGTYSRENGDANIMANYGLTDLLARSPEHYVEQGTRLGLDAELRAATKARIQEAWATKRPHFAARIAKESAALIDRIVEKEFGNQKS